MDAIRLSVIVFLLCAKYNQVPAQQGDRHTSRQLREVQQAGDETGSRDDYPNLTQGLVNLFTVQFHPGSIAYSGPDSGISGCSQADQDAQTNQTGPQ